MNISQFLDQTADSLDQVKWKQVTKELIDLWVTFFKVMVTLAIITYLTGKELGHVIHRLNDWLAAKWLQVLGLTGPTELGRASPTTVEIVEETIAVEVEPMLPLESLSTLFNTPLMIAAVREPVALLAPELQEQQTPARRRRRQSTPKSPQEVVKPESPLSQLRRPRGRRAHQERKKNRQAA
jgi:hypothetical protein